MTARLDGPSVAAPSNFNFQDYELGDQNELIRPNDSSGRDSNVQMKFNDANGSNQFSMSLMYSGPSLMPFTSNTTPELSQSLSPSQPSDGNPSTGTNLMDGLKKIVDDIFDTAKNIMGPGNPAEGLGGMLDSLKSAIDGVMDALGKLIGQPMPDGQTTPANDASATAVPGEGKSSGDSNAAQGAPSAPGANGGGDAADVADDYLHKRSDELANSGAIPMDKDCPADIDCANFVSACLEKAGKIDDSQRSNSVKELFSNLREGGWQETDLKNAKIGDPVAFDGPDGEYQHVEIFDGFDENGKPRFIGSNNVNSDGTQSITYDDGSWAHNFHVLTKG
jgi:hypothetical protein